METRQCKDCEEIKDIELFRPNTRQCWECRKSYLRDYERKNRKPRTAEKLAWAAANPEKVKEISRKTKAKNRNRVYAEVRKRRNIKLGADGEHSEIEWLELCNEYGNICLCCRQSLPLTRDHVIPLSKGGSDWITNIQPLCRACNSSKGAHHSTDYRINFAF